MINPVFPKAMLYELGALVGSHQCPRIPEPELAMDDESQVEAFFEAGGVRGALASIYYFNALQISALIRPGDVVLDLACGPANQLAILARLNPEAAFVGVDLAPNMLARAERNCARQGLDNLRFEEMDITRLEGLAAGSADVVYSTLALHHLPDLAALDACFAEIQRVLKPEGRLFLQDLARPRSARSIETLSRQYASRQPEVFTRDYRNSLHAAFLPADFARLGQRRLGERACLYTAPFLRFMMVLSIGPRQRSVTAEVLKQCREAVAGLEPCFQADHAALQRLFAVGRLPQSKAA